MTGTPPPTHAEKWPDGQPDWANGYLCGRRSGDSWLVVIPTIFGARLARWDCNGDRFIEAWYYEEMTGAVVAYALYPTPPLHWTRHTLPDHDEYPDVSDYADADAAQRADDEGDELADQQHNPTRTETHT